MNWKYIVSFTTTLEQLTVNTYEILSIYWIREEYYFSMRLKLDAFLEFLIWWFSIWLDKLTPGTGVINLRYRDEHAMESEEYVNRSGYYLLVMLFNYYGLPCSEMILISEWPVRLVTRVKKQEEVNLSGPILLSLKSA